MYSVLAECGLLGVLITIYTGFSCISAVSVVFADTLSYFEHRSSLLAGSLMFVERRCILYSYPVWSSSVGHVPIPILLAYATKTPTLNLFGVLSIRWGRGWLFKKS
jgi:hypothetical protein